MKIETKFLDTGGVLLLIGLIFGGCNDIHMKYAKSSSSKAKHIKNIGSMPLEFKEHALIANGDISIGGNLLAEGPLANIHTNSDFKASKSIKTSGKITAFSLNTKIKTSGKNTVSKTVTKKELTALRVSDAIEENTFENGVIFGADGNVFEIINGSLYPADINILGGVWSEGWSVRTGELALRKAVKFETDVFFDVEKLTALKPVYVQGTLKAASDFNINTGELFENVLVADKNIQLNSLSVVGRVHVGGDLIATGDVDIAGNLEIEGSTTVGGDLNLNYLDTVYKAALFSAKEKFDETLLVDSQVFKDANGKNSIAMFTFVKDYYQIDEQTIFDLLDTNQTDNFEFFTVVLGATIDYASEIVRYDGISPYYKNKLNIINELKKRGHYDAQVTEALNLPVMDMYLAFADKNGNKIGTYLLDSFDKNLNSDIISLSDSDRETYKNDTVALSENNNTSIFETLDAETRAYIDPESSEITAFLNEMDSNETASFLEAEQNLSSLKETYLSKSDQDLHAETEDMRVSEWLSYNNLDESIEEIEITQIVVDNSKITSSKHTNSWLSKKLKKLRKKLKRALKCGENKTSKIISDSWDSTISIHNGEGNNCTPISAAMVLRYQGKKISSNNSLYEMSSRYVLDEPFKWDYKLVKDLRADMKTSNANGTIVFYAPGAIEKNIKKRGFKGKAWLELWGTILPAVGRELSMSAIRDDIKHNHPLILNILDFASQIPGYKNDAYDNHSMPVLGHKETTYSGSCAWRPVERWLYVDTTWSTKRWYRYDLHSNYLKPSSLIRIRAHK